MFVDRIKVFAQAGSGGRGSVSFRREKFVPKGGPDGGDGGRGGNVVLRVERHVDNLANLFYEPIIKAKDGGHGKGKKMAGRAGANKIVKVPVGTIVWHADKEKRSTPNSQLPTPNSDQSAIGSAQSAMDLIIDLSYWSCERSRMPDWSVIRMQVNRHYCENFQLRGRRLRHIRSLLCIRL